jgi:uncharacterized protein (DUF2237 family)
MKFSLPPVLALLDSCPSVAGATFGANPVVDFDLTRLQQAFPPHSNVHGKPLQTCSKPGMAATGFTRSDKCDDAGNEDAGSHHICVDLSALQDNFCEVTGQPNWCDSSSSCTGDRNAMCPRKNWCVCQWAFAGYIQNSPHGCDGIGAALQCDAVNGAALRAYVAAAAENPQYKKALDCMRRKCNLDGAIEMISKRSLSVKEDKSAEDEILP